MLHGSLGVVLLQNRQPVALSSKARKQIGNMLKWKRKPQLYKMSMLKAPNILQRMMIALQRYNFTMYYVPDKELHIAN